MRTLIPSAGLFIALAAPLAAQPRVVVRTQARGLPSYGGVYRAGVPSSRFQQPGVSVRAGYGLIHSRQDAPQSVGLQSDVRLTGVGITASEIQQAGERFGVTFGLESQEVSNGSVESTWKQSAERFDHNLYARKKTGGTPIIAPSPARQTSGGSTSPAGRGSRKATTTKGRLPISRPEEDSAPRDRTLYSPSRLGEFEWDRETYALHWAFGIKPKTKVVEAFLGGIVHQTMENFSKWVRGGKAPDDIDVEDLVEVYHTLFDEQFDASKYHLSDDSVTVADHKRRGERLVRNYLARLKPVYRQIAEGKVRILFFENKMLYKVVNQDNGEEFRFQGVPDLVLEYVDEGVVEVSDFKTTVSPPTLDQLRSREYQLGSYVSAIEQNYPALKDKKFRIRYRYENFDQVYDFTPEVRANVNSRILNLLYGIRAYMQQVERDRAEWEKRLNPQRPPKKMAEAKKLVDRAAVVDEKMDKLKAQLKKLEAEYDTIMEQLLLFAKKTGNRTIPGATKDVVISEKDSAKTPTKSDDRENYDKLVKLVKDAGLWEQFSTLDLNELKNMAKLAGHPHHALYEKVKHLVILGMKQDIKLKDKADDKKK